MLEKVWIVSNEQLLDWVRHPVPASQLNSIPSFQCTTPEVSASEKICNGIPQNQEGLLARCAFPDFPFYTCVSDFATGTRGNLMLTALVDLVWMPNCSTKPWESQPAAGFI